MSETIRDLDPQSIVDIAPSTDIIWVQKTAGTPPADRRMSLGQVKDYVVDAFGEDNRLLGSPLTTTAGNVVTFADANGDESADSGIAATNLLLKSDNLASLTDAAVARTNLGLVGVADDGLHSSLTLDDGTNPHLTTKADVGLGSADNTADADKPVSTLQATAIATAKAEAIVDATANALALAIALG